jgi:hypothetical protein
VKVAHPLRHLRNHIDWARIACPGIEELTVAKTVKLVTRSAAMPFVR